MYAMLNLFGTPLEFIIKDERNLRFQRRFRSSLMINLLMIFDGEFEISVKSPISNDFKEDFTFTQKA